MLGSLGTEYLNCYKIMKQIPSMSSASLRKLLIKVQLKLVSNSANLEKLSKDLWVKQKTKDNNNRVKSFSPHPYFLDLRKQQSMHITPLQRLYQKLWTLSYRRVSNSIPNYAKKSMLRIIMYCTQ
jgi:hypothetical protein